MKWKPSDKQQTPCSSLLRNKQGQHSIPPATTIQGHTYEVNTTVVIIAPCMQEDIIKFGKHITRSSLRSLIAGGWLNKVMYARLLQQLAQSQLDQAVARQEGCSPVSIRASQLGQLIFSGNILMHRRYLKSTR